MFKYSIKTSHWLLVLEYEQASMRESEDFFDSLEIGEKTSKILQKELKKCKKTYKPRYKSHFIYKEVEKNVEEVLKNIVSTRHRQHKSIYNYWGGVGEWSPFDKYIPKDIIAVMVAKEANIPFNELKDKLNMEEYWQIIDAILYNYNAQYSEWQSRNKKATLAKYQEENKEELEKNATQWRELLKNIRSWKIKTKSIYSGTEYPWK